MINYFALTLTEMGSGNLEYAIIGVLIGFIIFKILKKRKRSAENIYKLINDLEKKYIY